MKTINNLGFQNHNLELQRDGSNSPKISTLDIKTRNGYMFLKNSLDSNKALAKPAIKQSASQKKFCRFKYFESLPKYSME